MAPRSRVRVGLIGAGWWATYAHIPALLALESVEIVAVARRNPAKLASVADRYGIPRRFTDYREMLQTVRMDAAIVSTPHAEHYPAAAEALARGCHVLLEKPMVLTVADGERLLAIAHRHQREIVLSLPFLFDSVATQARKLLDDGEIGQLEFVSSLFASRAAEFIAGDQQHPAGTERFPFEPPDPATYANPDVAGGGQGQTQVPHPSGFALWATGRRIVQVSAFMAGRGLSLDLFDTIIGRLDNGALFNLASLGTAPPSQPLQHQHQFYGDKGYLLVDLAAGWLSLHRADGSTVRAARPAEDPAYLRHAPAQHLVEVVRGAKNLAPGELGLRTVELVEAAYRSVRLNRVVDTSELAR